MEAFIFYFTHYHHLPVESVVGVDVFSPIFIVTPSVSTPASSVIVLMFHLIDGLFLASIARFRGYIVYKK
jgi:hypothetical protein